MEPDPVHVLVYLSRYPKVFDTFLTSMADDNALPHISQSLTFGTLGDEHLRTESLRIEIESLYLDSTSCFASSREDVFEFLVG